MSARPFVTANFAITADGRISTRNLTPADFSSRRDKRRLLEIRSRGDAILASTRTVAVDHMTMGLPAEDLREQRVRRNLPAYPTRVLLSNRGRIAPDLPIFGKTFSPIIIFSTKAMPRQTRTALTGKAILHLHPGDRVDLGQMMSTLRSDHGIRRLVCEGGSQVFRSLVAAGLVDELNLTVTPRIFGGKNAPTLTGIASDFLPASTHLKLKSCTPCEGECFLRYEVVR